jgi:hypothetical protein
LKTLADCYVELKKENDALKYYEEGLTELQKRANKLHPDFALMTKAINRIKQKRGETVSEMTTQEEEKSETKVNIKEKQRKMNKNTNTKEKTG